MISMPDLPVPGTRADRAASPIILALETSCDETGVTILRGFGEVAAEALHSQISDHAPYGGVVPEVASRSHLELLPGLVHGALRTARLSMQDIDAFAATTGPGLAPAVIVGACAARGMATGCRKPFLPVNHLEGHLLSPFFGSPSIPPHIALIVSGGHTLLFDVLSFRHYRLLGRTLDDAAGEAFDKVAKLLGLPYPGGIEIDRLARLGNPDSISFPRALPDQPDFSFSGLKTAVRVYLEKHPTASLPDICASFQEAVVDALLQKVLRAAKKSGHHTVALSGGVSSNTRLVEKARIALGPFGITLVVAPPSLRTDNAAMIAYVAAHQLANPSSPHPHPDIQPNFSPTSFPGIQQ
ncbi:MAG: tRNA (adenosine(37)-N6)-threonylcarbamoyltransferase complex transferase subunit TsaD [Terrimicrobiaceae bacterium]